MLLGSAGLALSGTLAGSLGGLGAGAWLASRAMRSGRVSARDVLIRACAALWLYATLAPTHATTGSASRTCASQTSPPTR